MKKGIILFVIFALAIISSYTENMIFTVKELNHELGSNTEEKSSFDKQDNDDYVYTRKNKIITFPNKFINYFFKENRDFPIDKILREWKLDEC